MRLRVFYRFLVRCAAIVLALAVLDHRSPTLRTPTSFEQIKEKKRRPRAVQAAILRAGSEAQRSSSKLSARSAAPLITPVVYRTPDPTVRFVERRLCSSHRV